jgi:hypothetical protein
MRLRRLRNVMDDSMKLRTLDGWEIARIRVWGELSHKVYWRIWPEGRIRGVLHVLLVGSSKGAQHTDVSSGSQRNLEGSTLS